MAIYKSQNPEEFESLKFLYQEIFRNSREITVDNASMILDKLKNFSEDSNNRHKLKMVISVRLPDKFIVTSPNSVDANATYAMCQVIARTISDLFIDNHDTVNCYRHYIDFGQGFIIYNNMILIYADEYDLDHYVKSYFIEGFFDEK